MKRWRGRRVPRLGRVDDQMANVVAELPGLESVAEVWELAAATDTG